MPEFINAHQVLWILVCWGTLSLALGAGFGWLWAEVQPRLGAYRGRLQVLFVACLLLAIVAFRQPSIWRSDCQQIDATCVLVAAQMLQADPVPFRGCTIGIHGPLGAYTLLPLHWLGLPLTPATARWFALLAVLVLTATTGAVAARYGGAGAAVPATLMVGLWAAFAKEMDFFEWNSEYPPAAALALAFWAFAVGRQAGHRAWAWLYGAGLLLGSVPYCKLQAVPQALLLAAIGLLDLGWSTAWAGRRRTGLLAFVLGGLTLPLLFTSVALATATWTDFINHYFGFALAYGSYQSFPWEAMRTSLSGFDMPWVLAFAVLVTGVPLVLAGRWWRGLPRAYWRWVAAAAANVFLAGYAIGTARTGYHHYAILLVAPCAWLCALLLGPAWLALCRAVRAARRWPMRVVVGHWALAVGCWAALYVWGASLQLTTLGDYAFVPMPHPQAVRYLPIATSLPLQNATTSKIAQRVRQFSRPHDRLAVWGWAPYYFLETGLPNATRYIISVGQMSPNYWVDLSPQLLAFFRQRYLNDLARHRPAWIIDAVATYEFGFQDRAQFGHETWPALAALIDADYVLLGELQVAPGDGTRVYLRRDVAVERLGTATVPRPAPDSTPAPGGVPPAH